LIDIIFIVLLVGGFAVYIYATKKMAKPSKKPKKKKTKVKSRKEKDETEIPEAWRKDNPDNPRKPVLFAFHQPTIGKIHVPGLRTAKRVIAGILLVINFFIAQATLMSAPASQPLYLLFILNAFILLDYLWKTRRKTA